MVVCGECGTRNALQTRFCTGCGSFLEWDGEPAESAREQTAAPVLAQSSADPATTTSEPTPSPPRLVRPDEKQQRYHAPVRDAAGPAGPDDVRCRHCGVGNATTRKFCRSCGGLLAVPGAENRRSWWRRLIARVTTRRSHEAGTRRRLRAPRGRLRLLAVVAVLAVAVVSAATVLPTRGLVDRAVTATRDRLADPVPVTPTAVRASSSARDAPARNISDGASNRYWAPATAAVGGWVEVDFARPVRLLDVLVTAGVSPDRKQFLTQGRPRELTVTVTDGKGRRTDTGIVVQDRPGQQTFAVAVNDAVRVRATIRSTYGMPPGRRCGIAELEFFIRG